MTAIGLRRHKAMAVWLTAAALVLQVAVPWVATPAWAAPPAPTGLTAVATHSFNTRLAWTDNSGGTAGYVINNGSTDSKTQPIGATGYDWGGQLPNTYACFTVRAINSSGTSAPAGPVCTTTPDAA